MDNAFLVAKYIPDLERMEPRNIGIVLWAEGRVKARFAEPDDLGLDIDEANFCRWIDYWQELARGERIQIHNRRPVSIQSSRYLREFQRAQEGSYNLEPGGEITDGIDNIEEALEFLFERLVSTASTAREAQRPAKLKEVCDNLLHTAGLFDRPDFVQNHAVPLHIRGTEKQLHFHYAVSANGHPRALLLRVNLLGEPSVTSTAGKFASVEKLGVCPTDHCLSLFEAVEDDEEENADTIDFLNYWSVAVNVASPDASQRIQQIVG